MITWMRHSWIAWTSLLWCGCGSYDVTSQPAHVVQPPAPEQPEGETEGTADASDADADAAPTDVSAVADTEGASPEDPETRPVGETDPPENFGGDPATAPLAVFLNVRDRPELLKMEQAVRDFEIIEGRFPNDLEEFMQQIVEAHQIQLPQPQPGYEFHYLPETGELVQRKTE